MIGVAHFQTLICIAGSALEPALLDVLLVDQGRFLLLHSRDLRSIGSEVSANSAEAAVQPDILHANSHDDRRDAKDCSNNHQN